VLEREHEKRNALKWDARASTYDQKRFDYFRWMQRKALGLLDFKAGMHFLDLGCGMGYAVCYVASEAMYEGVFCGIDLSPRMIEIAREKSIGFKCMRFEVASVT
jgi:ubiquinone/menaquinone biosynthesis C-methylase UbiE